MKRMMGMMMVAGALLAGDPVVPQNPVAGDDPVMSAGPVPKRGLPVDMELVTGRVVPIVGAYAYELNDPDALKGSSRTGINLQMRSGVRMLLLKQMTLEMWYQRSISDIELVNNKVEAGNVAYPEDHYLLKLFYKF